MDNKRFVDMHVHSTFSDGTFSPTEIVKLANEIGLKAIALTDHDTTDGIEEFITAGKQYDLEVISGIEFAAFNNDHKEIHILGYYIDTNDKRLNEHTSFIKKSRYDRNINMLTKLNDMGININYEELATSSGGDIISRAHYAKVMTEKGFVKTTKEAFEKYLSPGCSGYVERELYTAEEIIKTIKNSGGYAVLAHPTLYGLDFTQIELLSKELKSYGLDGIEVMYSVYSQEQELNMRNIAIKLDLKMTGGSDFHGENKSDIKLGTGFGRLKIPYTFVANLKL